MLILFAHFQKLPKLNNLDPVGSAGFSWIQTTWIERFALACPELKTLEWDILNPDRLIDLEINNKENKHNLIWRLRKRVYQALILISTIQKFPAQGIDLKYRVSHET